VEDQGPLVRLTYGILIAASRKGADKIAFRDEGAVELTINGSVVREFSELPRSLKDGVIRRIIVMSSLPVHGRGEEAVGYLQLALSEQEMVCFAVRVSGHGPSMSAVLRRVAAVPQQPHRGGVFR
jgi:type II secretory ATPase GspE/PulE/Tfp pilus assembly ATPase PilB-like protein